jgi:hypothetical protein
MNTIDELENWMNEHCYSDSYAIGSRTIFEGFGLKKENENFIWYFTERGQHNNLRTFNSEKEAVDYAHRQIFSDKYANRHLLAMVESVLESEKIMNELKYRNITFESDQIPYGGLNDIRTRIFVFGCDIIKANDLKQA